MQKVSRRLDNVKQPISNRNARVQRRYTNVPINWLIDWLTDWLFSTQNHDDVIKWKHFPRNWPFVRGIHRSPVNSPYKGQWRGALMFSLICVWINDWVNNREAGNLRRYRAHYDVTVMMTTYDTPKRCCYITGEGDFREATLNKFTMDLVLAGP